MNIIMSIHPKWAEKIYKGEKTIEWRKNFPKNIHAGNRIYLYETAPVCRVTGFVIYNGKFEFFPDNIELYPRAVEYGCVPLEKLKEYKGKSKSIFGWFVTRPGKFPLPLKIQNFISGDKPPQSWQYLKEEK